MKIAARQFVGLLPGAILPWFLGGCIVVPTVPMNAPGHGHTYRIVDEQGKPIAKGFLVVESFYRANPEMLRLYPIEDGKAVVPVKIATRCSAGATFLPFCMWIWVFYFENPYGTYVYPVSEGFLYKEGWNVAPWAPPGKPGELMDGLTPPPRVLQMRKVPPDLEREALDWLAGQGRMVGQPEDDQAARGKLKGFIDKRLAQLPPSKIVPLDKAIQEKNATEVRRLLDNGADVNHCHLANHWRPIFEAVVRDDKEMVMLLIERGAEVNVVDAQGASPLDRTQNEDIRKFLISQGAVSTLKHDDAPAMQPTSRPSGKAAK
ncbi:MAG: ankyrin repeat domain-containing protein [Planctomycetaceae bacterium]|nr:ankyrin repeat domain-containing protein [Planctomycetaceae bacterium]